MKSIKKYFLDVLLAITVIRVCFDYSIEQAIVSIFVVAVYGLNVYLENKKDIDQEKLEIQKLKEKVDALMIKNSARPDKVEGRRFF